MDPKNIEYQNGVFVLSNPADMIELVRSMRNRPAEEYNSEFAPVTKSKSQDEMLAEIADRLKAIEEKLQQQEQLIGQEFKKLAAVVQQVFAHYESERIKAGTERQQQLAEWEHRIIEEIGNIFDKKTTEAQQSSWWNKLFDAK